MPHLVENKVVLGIVVHFFDLAAGRIVRLQRSETGRVL